ncbi:MAG: hypothetical protein ACLS6G_07055 [Christensenellales bacterium]
MDFGTAIAMRGGKYGKRVSDRGYERRMRGTLVQRMLCAAMMAILSFARLPAAGIAVRARCLLCCCGGVRSGGLCGRYAGLCRAVCRRGVGSLLAAPRLHDLWLSTGLWAKPANRMTDGGGGFLIQLTAAAVTGVEMGMKSSSFC